MNSNQKGKRAERELAKVLTSLFGKACSRGQQFSGLGGDDVVGLDGVHIECKHVQTLNVEAAMRQSEREAGPVEVPVVCHKRNRTEWLLTVRLAKVPELLRVLNETTANPTRQQTPGSETDGEPGTGNLAAGSIG